MTLKLKRREKDGQSLGPRSAALKPPARHEVNFKANARPHARHGVGSFKVLTLQRRISFREESSRIFGVERRTLSEARGRRDGR